MSHPNKREFLGILTFTDTPSDQPTSGSRGHKILVSSGVIDAALPSLIGMGVNYSGKAEHAPRQKCGVVTAAWRDGKEVMVSGYVYPYDFPDLIRICASAGELGMSFELKDAHVTDMRASIWEISKFWFTGAAVIQRGKTAWKQTEFVLL